MVRDHPLPVLTDNGTHDAASRQHCATYLHPIVHSVGEQSIRVDTIACMCLLFQLVYRYRGKLMFGL